MSSLRAPASPRPMRDRHSRNPVAFVEPSGMPRPPDRLEGNRQKFKLLTDQEMNSNRRGSLNQAEAARSRHRFLHRPDDAAEEAHEDVVDRCPTVAPSRVARGGAERPQVGE